MTKTSPGPMLAFTSDKFSTKLGTVAPLLNRSIVNVERLISSFDALNNSMALLLLLPSIYSEKNKPTMVSVIAIDDETVVITLSVAEN